MLELCDSEISVQQYTYIYFSMTAPKTVLINNFTNLNVVFTVAVGCSLVLGIDEVSQNCQSTDVRESEEKMTKDQHASHKEHYALVPYSTDGFLSEFYERNKTIMIPGMPRQLMIRQNWQKNGVAGVVWEAASVLSAYIVDNYDLRGKQVIELGAGTGLVGMVAAEMGAHVTVTDTAKALPLLEENMVLNFPHKKRPVARELEWGKELHAYAGHFHDFIFGADIIYLESTFDDLLETLHYLANTVNASNRTKIVLSAKIRYDRVTKFVKKLQTKFTNVSNVHQDQASNVVIYECF